MKQLFLSLAVILGCLSFVGCSSDDEPVGPKNYCVGLYAFSLDFLDNFNVQIDILNAQNEVIQTKNINTLSPVDTREGVKVFEIIYNSETFPVHFVSNITCKKSAADLVADRTYNFGAGATYTMATLAEPGFYKTSKLKMVCDELSDEGKYFATVAANGLTNYENFAVEKTNKIKHTFNR